MTKPPRCRTRDGFRMGLDDEQDIREPPAGGKVATMSGSTGQPWNLALALAYAAAGVKVFPISEKKVPRVKYKTGGADEQPTTDPERIRRWFGKEFPNSYVAAQTGSTNGFFVTDIDEKNGVSGSKSLKELGVAFPPDTPVVKTQSGGKHYYNAHAHDLPGTIGDLGPGIDTRGEGSIVVLPSCGDDPKDYPARVASFVQRARTTPIPDSLLPHLLAAKKEAPPPSDRPAVFVEVTTPYGRMMLEKLEASISDVVGNRAKTLFNNSQTIGGLVAGGEIAEEDAWSVLDRADEITGLPTDEAARHAMNGYNFGLEKPLFREAFDVSEYFEPISEPVTKASIEPTSISPSDWKKELIYLDKAGTIPRANLANVLTAFRHAPAWQGVIAYDQFANSTVMVRPAPFVDAKHFTPRQWTDGDDALSCEWLQRRDLDVSVTTVHTAVEAVAAENAFNPVQNFLSDCEKAWDGKPRLSLWLTTYLGVTDTPLTRAFAAKWMISAVARAYRPGCKADCMLILEGPQGVGKSTVGDILGGAFFSDDLADVGSKDAAMIAGSSWIIEMSELGAMSRAEEAKKKSYQSRRVDKFRPPFGRRVITVPRASVFIGSTNDDQYLRDETGGRRFWPVRVERLDDEALRRDREQLWGEAVHRFKAGETWWLDGPELVDAAADEQSARYASDPWHDLIAAYLDDQTEDVSIADVMSFALCINSSKHDRQTEMRCAKVLKTLGWERYQPRIEGKRCWRYRRPVSPTFEALSVTNLAAAPTITDGVGDIQSP